MNFKYTKRAKWLTLLLVLVVWFTLIAATNTTSTSGFPQTYAFRSTGTHANTETTNLQCGGRTCSAGTYEVIANMGVTSAYVAGSGSGTVSVSDGTATRTMIVGPINLASTSTGFDQKVGVFDYAGSGTLTFGFTVTSGNTSGSVYQNVDLKRLR